MRRVGLHKFTIVASGVDTSRRGFEDRFFEAGCDDATISLQKGALILEFDREAPTFLKAVATAVRDVRRAGANVERLEPDHLVSLSDIADRSGMTRASASNFARGLRGSGFPVPVARVTSDTPLWDWLDVSRWLYRRKRIPLDVVVEAKIVRSVNVIAIEGGTPTFHVPFAGAIVMACDRPLVLLNGER